MNHSIIKIYSFLKENIRYELALFVLAFVFLVNNDFFVDRTIRPEDCQNGGCVAEGEFKPNLSKSKPYYYIENIPAIERGNYYSLTLQLKSDRDTKIIVRVTSDSLTEQEVKTLDLRGGADFVFQQLLFKADKYYSKVFIEKENYEDESNIFVSSVNVSRLDIKNDKELAALSPATFGAVNLGVIDQEQIADESVLYANLQEPKTTLGQTFIAAGDYISGVTLKMEVTKPADVGSRQFNLQLRRVESEGEMIKAEDSIITNFGFSLSGIERYRQLDGTFRFPIFARLEKGERYLLSIDNKKIEDNKYSYLALRGSDNDSAYPNGSMTLQKVKTIYKLDRDLFFKIHGASFTQSGGRNMLSASLAEDLGNGHGSYVYKNKSEEADMLDVYAKSADVEFNGEDGVIAGRVDADDSFWIYQIETAYPFSRLAIGAEQADKDWGGVTLEYSFDQKKWEVLQSIDDSGFQKFDATILGDGRSDVIFLRTSPDESKKGKSRFYGLKNFEIKGELIIK
ncbi:hypothetical protein EPO05_02885 [Patescibacteria group bacterium]|nr:MAG: hypothetical protein EPO05_02885 [Patescibacteria group bacterium]